MDEDGGEKKHEATPHRREQALREGQVGRSQDLPAAFVLLAAVILLMTVGHEVARLFAVYTRFSLREPFLLIAENMEGGGLFNSVIAHFYGTTTKFLGQMSLFFGILLLIAVGANLAQVGFLWLPQKLAFNPSHLDPIKGFGRIFSMQSVMRLIMGIGKIIICAVVAYYAVRGEIETILGLTHLEEPQICAYLARTLLLIALKVAVALVLIALLDFMYQKWKFNQDIRMTDQQLKQEIKNMLGDETIRMRRRQMQQELARGQRSVQGAADADVVVTNPTHLAIALKFDRDTMHTPIVVAKGAEYIAQIIKRIALEHGVPTYEHKPLAQSLYKTVEVGQSIRMEHYEPVAEILRFVNDLKRAPSRP